MDDILRTTIENKLSEINSLHPNLKFTLEVEKNGKLIMPTDNFIKQLKCSKAAIQPVVTLRKQKTFLPSLKPNVK